MAIGLLDKIHQDLESVVRQKDQDGVRTLRFLLSNIQNLVIEKYPPTFAKASVGKPEKTGLTDEDVISVVQKLVKTHKESIEAFRAGGRSDLVSQEEVELALLQKYLPQGLSEDEIRKMVKEATSPLVDSGAIDFGKIMGQVMAKAKGRADGATVAKIVKEVLGDSRPNL